jgi:hypothetical protein
MPLRTLKRSEIKPIESAYKPQKSAHNVWRGRAKTAGDLHVKQFGDSNSDKSHAVLEAVYSDMYKKVLAKQVPDVYLVVDDDGRVYGLASETLKDFESFRDYESRHQSVELSPEHKQQLAKMLAIAFWLGENDLHPNNWGFATVDGQTMVVKIDHDMSLWPFTQAVKAAPFLDPHSQFPITGHNLEHFPNVDDAPRFWLGKKTPAAREKNKYSQQAREYFNALETNRDFIVGKWQALLDITQFDVQDWLGIFNDRFAKNVDFLPQISPYLKYRQEAVHYLLLQNEGFKSWWRSQPNTFQWQHLAFEKTLSAYERYKESVSQARASAVEKRNLAALLSAHLKQIDNALINAKAKLQYKLIEQSVFLDREGFDNERCKQVIKEVEELTSSLEKTRQSYLTALAGIDPELVSAHLMTSSALISYFTNQRLVSALMQVTNNANRLRLDGINLEAIDVEGLGANQLDFNVIYDTKLLLFQGKDRETAFTQTLNELGDFNERRIELFKQLALQTTLADFQRVTFDSVERSDFDVNHATIEFLDLPEDLQAIRLEFETLKSSATTHELNLNFKSKVADFQIKLDEVNGLLKNRPEFKEIQAEFGYWAIDQIYLPKKDYEAALFVLEKMHFNTDEYLSAVKNIVAVLKDHNQFARAIALLDSTCQKVGEQDANYVELNGLREQLINDSASDSHFDLEKLSLEDWGSLQDLLTEIDAVPLENIQRLLNTTYRDWQRIELNFAKLAESLKSFVERIARDDSQVDKLSAILLGLPNRSEIYSEQLLEKVELLSRFITSIRQRFTAELSQSEADKEVAAKLDLLNEFTASIDLKQVALLIEKARLTLNYGDLPGALDLAKQLTNEEMRFVLQGELNQFHLALADTLSANGDKIAALNVLNEIPQEARGSEVTTKIEAIISALTQSGAGNSDDRALSASEAEEFNHYLKLLHLLNDNLAPSNAKSVVKLSKYLSDADYRQLMQQTWGDERPIQTLMRQAWSDEDFKQAVMQAIYSEPDRSLLYQAVRTGDERTLQRIVSICRDHLA